MKQKRIHITGASGSGTTTLGKALATNLGYSQLDTDKYYWLPTEPPYQEIRAVEARQSLLQKDMLKYDSWISTGSICRWGDFALGYFDLVIFLYIPHNVRIKRLFEREKTRCPESFTEDSIRAKQFKEFIDWAKLYDDGGEEVRSLYMHNQWLKKLSCPILRIEEELPVEELIARVETFIETL